MGVFSVGAKKRQRPALPNLCSPKAKVERSSPRKLPQQVRRITKISKAGQKPCKSEKIVSKKASAAGKKNYKNIQGWTKAVQQAKKALGVKGFCAVGGKSAQGKALYAKAKAIYSGA